MIWRTTYTKSWTILAHEKGSKNKVTKQDERQQKKPSKFWQITIKLQYWCLKKYSFHQCFSNDSTLWNECRICMMPQRHPWGHQRPNQGNSLVLLTTDVIMHNIQPYGFSYAVLFIILLCHRFICHIITIAILASPHTLVHPSSCFL